VCGWMDGSRVGSKDHERVSMLPRAMRSGQCGANEGGGGAEAEEV
jgi:hypothetical protein